MSPLCDIGPSIAELKAIAKLIHGLAFAGEDIRIELDSLRRASDLLLDLANELELFMGDALDPPITEAPEHQAAPAAARAERDAPGSCGDREQAQAQCDLRASWAKMVRQQTRESSTLSAVPIVVMAANLSETQA